MPKAAPVCRAALGSATKLWPERSRISDGICADANHSSSSDHNDPDRDGYCEAFDLTHDPARGCDAHALVREAVRRRDPRIKYAISQGRIWSAARAAEGWRHYFGPNPHNAHAHVSTSDAHRDSLDPWWGSPEPALPPVPPPILGTPMEVDVNIRPIQIEMPLDDQGRGNVSVAYPIDRIVGFLPHSEVRPNVDGRYDSPVNSVTFTPEGDRTIVVVQHDDPLGRAFVWLRVVE